MNKIAEKQNFELWHRPYDSGVFVDNFTVTRGSQRWQLGFDGARMIDTLKDREMQKNCPIAYGWAVLQIGLFCLQRARRMLQGNEEIAGE